GLRLSDPVRGRTAPRGLSGVAADLECDAPPPRGALPLPSPRSSRVRARRQETRRNYRVTAAYTTSGHAQWTRTQRLTLMWAQCPDKLGFTLNYAMNYKVRGGSTRRYQA